jgi:putative membrane protein
MNPDAHGPDAHDQAGHASALVLDAGLPLLLLALLGMGYLVLALRHRSEPRGWPLSRAVYFLAGLVLLGLGLNPGWAPYRDGSFPEHMFQHLLIGMYAPLCLVLGAPMTLLLRTLPPRYGQRVGQLLRSRPLHVLAHPVTALVLSVGGLAVLYFTPLYAAVSGNAALHHLVHLHFIASGYLFAWVIAGPDPAPRRPSVRNRLVVLGVAVAAHAVLSQLIYAGLFVRVQAAVGELRQAGELMYYAGDIAELLLAFALVSTWRPARDRPRRTPGSSVRRRQAPAAVRSPS